MGEVILVANIVIGTLFATSVGLAVAWMRARERAIRAELARPHLTSTAEARLDALQDAVDAIAVEVERISEGQRFTSRLLTERSPGVERPRVPERITTPR